MTDEALQRYNVCDKCKQGAIVGEIIDEEYDIKLSDGLLFAKVYLHREFVENVERSVLVNHVGEVLADQAIELCAERRKKEQNDDDDS